MRFGRVVTFGSCVAAVVFLQASKSYRSPAPPSVVENGPTTSGLKSIRFGSLEAVGLPRGSHVNAAMFAGVQLSSEQKAKVIMLATTFFAERRSILGSAPHGKLSPELKQRLLPFIERQRLAYRGILTRSQQAVFDENVKRVMASWNDTDRAAEGR